MKRSSAALLCLLALATALRLWGAFDKAAYDWDERDHVASAVGMLRHGTTVHLNWPHPPVGFLMLGATVSAFGDTPAGWRTNDLVFGVASVLLVFLIGRLLFPGTAVPLLAAALLGLDPFHAYFSRTTMMEIPATCFFLLYLLLMLEFAENGRRTLPFAGLAMGLTMATKAYFVFAIPVVALYALARVHRRGEPLLRLAGDFVLSLGVLPASVLLLSYFPWFGRGYDLGEFVRMNLDGLRTLQELQPERFPKGDFLLSWGRPWEWFLKPMLAGADGILANGGDGRYALLAHNPPFRLLVLPATAILCHETWRRRAAKDFILPAAFLASYLLFVALRRPLFFYSALAVLPLAWLIVARAVTLVGERMGQARGVAVAALCVVLLWGAYSFPLVTAGEVPMWLYRPLTGPRSPGAG